MVGKCIVITSHRLGYGVRRSYRLQVAVKVPATSAYNVWTTEELWTIDEMLPSHLPCGGIGNWWRNKAEALRDVKACAASLPYPVEPGIYQQHPVKPLERIT